MPSLSAICVCPRCRSAVEQNATSWLCTSCSRTYPIVDGFPDFSPEIRHQGGIGQLGMEIPLLVAIYENRVRPNFVRSMGKNWDGALTPEGEDAYLVQHVAPADGPVMDLACGAGRWTRTLVQNFANNVVGFDLSYASLRACREALPDTVLVRGNAFELPFGDATLGAVNCSNSLQLIPNTPRVLMEIGRTLKPGGTFTCFTYRKSPPGAYRAFQATVEKIMGVRAFTLPDIETWLNAAGMELMDVSGPNLVLLFTARKRA